MSGTSLDGVDGVLARFPADGMLAGLQTLSDAYVPFPAALRAELMALQTPGENEIQREALAANALAAHYADCVAQLLANADISRDQIRAIGVHGQTVRHRPELGYTRQTNNPALLAELTGIDVVADFRSRDIAAGGQGAPLVPAFHQAAFGTADSCRVVINIGGISNISVLDNRTGAKGCGNITGFDTGPGNVLMDAWTMQHQNQPYDADGLWAASGTVLPALLESLSDDAFFALAPPKSTGRDLFHPGWLAADVQATLAAFTAHTLAAAIAQHATGVQSVYVCGGGAYNGHLMQALALALRARGQGASVQSTAVLGLAPNQVEALAFAWLTQRFCRRQSGNLPAVTGAQGLRILGALYPGT
jgi:anhydro-N-acetylmuramic acid kinase